MKLYFLPFGHMPYLDTTVSPAYEIVYFLQYFGGTIHGVVHAAADTLFFSFATLACGQFDALISSLRNLGKTDNNAELIACIRHHHQLIRYCICFHFQAVGW